MSLYSGTNGVLEQCLGDILHMLKPLENDRLTRLNVINKIATSIQQSTRGATLNPFGSFVSNLYTKWGDLDLSIDVSTASGDSKNNNYKRKLLKGIIKTLRNSGVAHYIEFIPNARVPLLKFKSTFNGISCDISVDNYLGVFKSKILLWISEIDERFRDMVLLTKEWAKTQQINDPRLGTLNSYSLCLLVIFHLQTCEPAILPPLMEIYQGNLDEIKGTNLMSERHFEDVCAVNIRRFRSQTFRKENRSSVGQLLLSFFQKFYNIKGLVSDNVICTYTGKWEGRNSLRCSEMSGVMIVDDPFEKPANAARSVGANGLSLISDAFINTYDKLSSLNVLADKKQLLAILTNKHHIISKPEVRSKHWNNTRGSHTVSTNNGFLQRQHIPHLESSSRSSSMHVTQNHNMSFSGVIDTYDSHTRGSHNVSTNNGFLQRQYVPHLESSSRSSSMQATQNHNMGFSGVIDTYDSHTRGSHAVNTNNGFLQRQYIPHLESSSRSSSMKGTQNHNMGFSGVIDTYDSQMNSNIHNSKSSSRGSGARGIPAQANFPAGNGVYGARHMGMHKVQETTDVRGQVWRPKFT